MSIRRLFDAVGGLAAGALDQFPFCAWAGTPCKLSVGLDDAMVIVPKLAPNGKRVVLIHKHQNLRVEIYSARLTGGGPPVRLSAAGEDCGFVAISPDSIRVLYFVLAGTGQPGDPVRRELFSAPIAGPASARVTLAADVSAAVDDVNVRVSPDSGMVVFAPPERDQLRVVPIAGPASAAQRLTDPFAVGGKVSEFEISASGSVVYLADQDTDGVTELYRVPLTLSPAPDPPTTTLNGPLAAGGDVTEFTLTLNSRAVYLADQDTDGVTELYSVRLDGTDRVKLNGTLLPGWNVLRPGRARILPDGSRAVYVIGHVDGDGRVFGELYSVPIAGPGSASVRLDHPPLIPPGQIRADDYELSADSSRVVYTMVDQNVDEPVPATISLASVPATGPASAGKLLAPPLNPDGYIFTLSPDSGRVAYHLLAAVDAQNNLFSVPIGGGTSVRLNGAENLQGGVLRINANSTRAVYEARTATGPALFSVPLDGPAYRTRNLTKSLTGTWRLQGHALTAGIGTAVYTIQRGGLDAPVEAFSSRLTPAILPPLPLR